MTQILSSEPVTSRLTQPHVTDARPILRRSDSNIWERTEHMRADLERVLEERCRDRSIDALTLQSDPYVHPAWVKFECWLPKADPAVTARSWMTITITAMPYHRFEAIYKVEWEKHGHKGVIDQLHTCGEAELAGMIEFLSEAPGNPFSGLWRSRAYKLLRPMQLRQQAWQIWKPRNKVEGVRRDRLAVASVGTLVLGLILLLNATPASVARTFAHSYLPSILRVPSGSLAPAIALAATRSFQEQNRPSEHMLTAGVDSDGVLTEQHPTRGNGAPYQLWTYRAQAGERFVVTLRSDQFDSYLIIGHFEGDTFTPLGQNDDFGDASHSRLEVTAPESREYVVVASALGPAAGRYTLRVEQPAGRAHAASAAASTPLSNATLQLDAPANASLTGTDYGPGLLFLSLGLMGLVVYGRAPRLIRSSGKPLAEPRILYSLDSWQTVVFGAGADAGTIRQRLISHFNAAPDRRFAFAQERVWYWGLDGKTEREQLVLRYGRALVFCQIHAYGTDLYVGWNAQMNLGTWREKRLASGVDVGTGERVRLTTVEHATQWTNEYDLTDLNSLAEWTHAQMAQILKHYLKEREIDQEIDFSIIRGERKGLTGDEKKEKGKRFTRQA
jgi:hypothetical protein